MAKSSFVDIEPHSIRFTDKSTGFVAFDGKLDGFSHGYIRRLISLIVNELIRKKAENSKNEQNIFECRKNTNVEP